MGIFLKASNASSVFKDFSYLTWHLKKQQVFCLDLSPAKAFSCCCFFDFLKNFLFV